MKQKITIEEFVRNILSKYKNFEIAGHMTEALNMINTYDKIVVEWPRGHSKTTFFTFILPLYIAYNDPDVKILIVKERMASAEDCTKRIKHAIKNIPSLRAHIGNPESIRACGFYSAIYCDNYNYVFFDDVESNSNTTNINSIKKNIEIINKNFIPLDVELAEEERTKLIYVCTPQKKNDMRATIKENITWKVISRPAITKKGRAEIPPLIALYDGNKIKIEYACSQEELKQYSVLWENKRPMGYLMAMMLNGLSMNGLNYFMREYLLEPDVEAI